MFAFAKILAAAGIALAAFPFQQTAEIVAFSLDDAQEVLIQESAQIDTQDAAELGMAISYDNNIKCGEPVTFTAQAYGGSGDYLYLLGGWNTVVDGKIDYLTDPTQYAYSKETTTQMTFYASGTYYFYAYVMDRSSMPMVSKRVVTTVTVDDPDYPSVSQIADRVASECLAAGCATDYEKALWLHDWIINNMDYDYKGMLYCGAEGALARGLGICESYHRGYALLLERVGIETARVTGNGHVWTGIKLDGKWYQVDATWDDPGYEDPRVDLEHLYFCLNDELMSTVHSDHTPNQNCPSNSLDLNYFVQNGQAALWAAQYAPTIQKQLDEGSTSFDIEVASNPYGKVIYGITAYQLCQTDWAANDRNVKLEVTFENDRLHCVAAFAAQQGDINSDGSINMIDQVLLHRRLTNETTFDADQIKASDMDNNGAIEKEDLERLAKLVITQ